MTFSRDYVVFLFLDTFEYGKRLETGETTKSLEIMTFSRDFVLFLFLDTIRKVSRNRKMTKSLVN